jgi:hypothetical protein
MPNNNESFFHQFRAPITSAQFYMPTYGVFLRLDMGGSEIKENHLLFASISSYTSALLFSYS